MPQFLAPITEKNIFTNKRQAFQQMQTMVESRSIEECNLSRHQMHVYPTFGPPTSKKIQQERYCKTTSWMQQIKWKHIDGTNCRQNKKQSPFEY